MVLKYSFKINGTEIGLADGAGPNLVLVGTKIELSRENQNGNTCRLIVPTSALSVALITAGKEVIISRGAVSAFDKIVFKGNIKEIQTNDNDTVTLICLDPLQKLKYQLFVESYDRNIDPEAGELSEIFKDIAEQGGFSVSRVRSGISASSITVDKFKSNNNSRLNRLNLIQNILNWVFYYDYENDFVRLEPKGYVTYPNPLTVGQNVLNLPVWEENIEGMRNKITVTGAAQLDTRNDSFTGTGSQSDFILTYEPVSIETTIDGVLQVLGIEGATSGFDYQLDRDLKTVSFVTPPTDSTSIVISYTTLIPTPIIDESYESISKYGLTQEEEFNFPDVVTISDAEVRVQQLIQLLQDAQLSTSIFTTEYDIKVGDNIIYVNPNNGLYDGTYVVSSKNINYGEEYDVVKIGTPKIDLRNVFITINERLKLLEEGDRGLGEILRFLISLVRPKLRWFRKSLKLEKRNASNSFIIGHQTLGRIRSGYDMEADCSDNGNHGTWYGTGVATGTQFEIQTVVGSPPVQHLSAGIFNGSDRQILSTGVSETSIRCASLFINPEASDGGLFQIDSGKYISITSTGTITTTNLTNPIIETTVLDSGITHVYVEFDSMSMINPIAGNDGVNFYDGKLDELMTFNTTLSVQDKIDIQENRFYTDHSKFANCKLWWSFDNPLIGDRRTAYTTEIDTTY